MIMRTRQENPATREKLLETAEHLMLAKGYTATSVEEICEDSDLTKGSFFHYFASKEDLGKAVLDRYVNSMFLAAQNAPFSKKSDPLQRLYGYIDFMIAVAKDPARRSGCLLGNFAQVLTDTNPGIRTQCAAHFRLWADTLKHELDAAKTAYKVKGLDTGTLADHFIALFEGSLMLAKTRQDKDVIANSLAHFKKYLKSIFVK
jgi:TetR/AcrR family transcriptional repressor of nem operon